MMINNKNKGCSSIPPTPEPYPYLVFSHGKSSNVQTFYDIPRDCHYTRRLPYIFGKLILASCQGWMVALDDELNDDELVVCSLCNVISMAKIDLPPFEDNNIIRKCVLSSPPTDPNCILAFFGVFGVRFWRPGQNKWVSHEFTNNEVITDVIACEGKIYCRPLSRDFFAIKMAPNGNKLELTRLETEFPMSLQPCYTQLANFLIEFGGEIYYVCIVFKGARVRTRIKDIDVFKFEKSSLDWIVVDDIGNGAFFISGRNNKTSSSSASALGLKPNSIYFVNGEEKTLYVFDIKRKLLHQSLPCPNVVHNLDQIFWLRLSV